MSLDSLVQANPSGGGPHVSVSPGGTATVVATGASASTASAPAVTGGTSSALAANSAGATVASPVVRTALARTGLDTRSMALMAIALGGLVLLFSGTAPDPLRGRGVGSVRSDPPRETSESQDRIGLHGRRGLTSRASERPENSTMITTEGV